MWEAWAVVPALPLTIWVSLEESLHFAFNIHLQGLCYTMILCHHCQKLDGLW